MSVYIFALGIKASNGLVKSTVNTANAFVEKDNNVAIINILGKNGGFDFLDPAFDLDERVARFSLDAMSMQCPKELSLQEFHTEDQQFLKAVYHGGHKRALQVINHNLTENDLVIFSHPLAMVLFAKANPKTRAKTIIQVHGNYIEEVDNLNLLKGYVDYVDYIQTVSLYMKDDLIQILGLSHDSDKVKCIYNITRPIKLHKKKEDFLKRISIVGSIQKRKNQLDAIKMLSLIKDRNVVLQIYGKPLKQDYMNLINSYIDFYGLKDRVLFKGICTEQEIYENTDLVVMTSEHEGYPYIFMESTVYQIPIVAYDFKYGAAEFTCDNANGCLIPMFDYQQMAQIVNRLLTNPDAYQEVIDFNKHNFEEKYSQSSILREYYSLFVNKNNEFVFDFTKELQLEIDKDAGPSVEEDFCVESLDCEPSSIEITNFWDNKSSSIDVFRISMSIVSRLKNLKFFYLYKKSRFDVQNEYADEGIGDVGINSVLSHEQEVLLNIPQKNRLSFEQVMHKFDLYCEVNNKVYHCGTITKNDIVKPNNKEEEPDSKIKLNNENEKLAFAETISIQPLFGKKTINQVPHILRPNGFFIRYPSFDAIRSIKNEDGEVLRFSTHMLRFYGENLLFFKLKDGLYKKLYIETNSRNILEIDFSEYSYKSVFLKLQKTEEQFNLFDVKLNNIYAWELVRATIFEHILESVGVLGQHFSKAKPVNNVYFGNKTLCEMPNAEILLFEFPRKNNLDFRTLAAQTEFADNMVVLEYPQEYGYSDATYDTASKQYPIGDFLNYCKQNETKIEFSGENKQIIRWLKQVFIDALGIDIEFSLFFHSRILKFLREFNYFDKIFQNHRFKEVMIPSAYWSAGIVAAAKKNNVITSDIQYALISRYHPSFSFPVHARAYGAERVYLWSKYWNIEETAYNKSKILKSNYFKEKLNRIDSVSIETAADIAFVSQGRVGKKIFKFALDFAKKYPNRSIVFCPHPDEEIMTYNGYDELDLLPNLRLNDQSETLMAIMQVRVVIGAYSTSLIEALALGKKVFSLTVGGHEVMEREVEAGYIQYITNCDELEHCMDQPMLYDKNEVFSLFYGK